MAHVILKIMFFFFLIWIYHNTRYYAMLLTKKKIDFQEDKWIYIFEGWNKVN